MIVIIFCGKSHDPEMDAHDHDTTDSANTPNTDTNPRKFIRT